MKKYETEWAESTKFLGVLLDEHLIWKPHIKCIENKIGKYIGLSLKAKPFVNRQSLLSLYYSYIHSYIKHANVAWESTYLTNLKRLLSQQKHAMRIICNKGKFEYTKQLFQSNKILNVYNLNILNVATFIRLIKKLLQMIFFQDFKNRIIFIQLDSRNWTTYNQFTILKHVNTQFQLEDHISGIAFLSPKRSKSLLCVNLKL